MNPKLPPSDLHKSKQRIILITLGMMLLFYLLDVVVDSFLFDTHESFHFSLTELDPYEIYFRSLVVTLLAVFGGIAWWLLRARIFEQKQIHDQSLKLRHAQSLARLSSWEYHFANQTFHGSQELTNLLGLEAGQSIDLTNLIACIHPNDRDEVESALANAKSHQISFRLQHRLITLRGEERLVQHLGEVILDENLQPQGLLGTLQDITELKIATNRSRMLETVFDHLSEPVVISDSNRCVVEINHAFEKMVGYPLSQIKGQDLRFLKPQKQEGGWSPDIWQTMEEMGYWDGEVSVRKRNQEIFPCALSLYAFESDRGERLNVGILRDISVQKSYEEALLKRALYDQLTGLPNRANFQERFFQMSKIARREHHQMALLFLDLDGFKAINDTYGHDAGDFTLKTVANRIKTTIREADVAARFAGDEFVVALGRVHSLEDATLVGENLLANILTPFNYQEHLLRIGASIGISLTPQHGSDLDDLIKKADQAMYLAKKYGKGRVIAYQEADSRNE